MLFFFGKSVGVTADELGRADKKMRLMTDALVADVYIYIYRDSKIVRRKQRYGGGHGPLQRTSD